TITTYRLAGVWARLGPTSGGSRRMSATLKDLYGPFSNGHHFSGTVRCRGTEDCPGMRADLRNITEGDPVPVSGREGLIFDFDADATFETGVTCHFAGVTLWGVGLSALASNYKCTTAAGVPTDPGKFWLRVRGAPTSSPSNL